MKGETLKKLRKRAGFATATEFAAKAGMSQQAYSRYENEDLNPTLDRAQQFCELLDCTLEELCSDEISIDTSKQEPTIQSRYNALSEESKADFERHLDYLEFRDAGRKRLAKTRNNASNVAEVLLFIQKAHAQGVEPKDMRELFKNELEERVEAQIIRQQKEKAAEWAGSKTIVSLEEFQGDSVKAIKKQYTNHNRQLLKVFDDLAGDDLLGIEDLVTLSVNPPSGYEYSIRRF